MRPDRRMSLPKPDVAVGGKPADQLAQAQEAEPTRPADAWQARATTPARLIYASSSRSSGPRLNDCRRSRDEFAPKVG